jgi:nucleoside transporter
MTANSASAPVSSGMLRPEPAPGIKFKLSIMMFLQYGIWGAWLPLFFAYLTGHLHIPALKAGLLFSIGALGALLAPFIAGQIADRYFNTEKFLAISHILGAFLVWKLADVTTWNELVIFSLLYSVIYAPTLALTNSLAFHHLPDRDRDFGKVRVWGTIGWIVVGIGVAQWLLYKHSQGATPAEVQANQLAGMADALRASAILGVAMGIYCLVLPKTPPSTGKQPFAAAEAMHEVVRQPLLILFIVSFFVACIHQFYFVMTAPFLNSLNIHSALVNRIFGVGGGGLMTIGQMSELVVLAIMPFVIKSVPRKTILAIGLLAYVLRFFIFAYVPHPGAVIPALALHGVCFGCFFFVAFMIVDQFTTKDVRASAQSLYNVVLVGFGTIVGNYFAGKVGQIATKDGVVNFKTLFAVPMWVALACLFILLIGYPRNAQPREEERGFEVVR